MRAICWALALALVGVSEVQAQTVEVSGSVGAACRAGDGVLCVQDHAVSLSGEAGLVFGRGFQVSGRWGRIRLPERRSPSFQPSFVTEDRTDSFVTGELLYHFQPDRKVRVFVGGGIGRMGRTQTIRCLIPRCEAGTPPGTSETWRWDPVFAAGVLFLPLESLAVRSSLRIHTAFGDSAPQEMFLLSVGYRFGLP